MGALDGLKVVDFGLLVQGPQAASMLCDMGAEVVKIELPGIGDQARWVTLSQEDRRAPYFVACNRGKRSATVDARTEAGADVVKRLSASADVIISNFAEGTMGSWGLGYDVLSELNPRLVYAVGSMLGTEGPDSGRKGADLAAQAMGGLISTTGSGAGDVSPVGVAIADHIASQNLVAGILAALLARERTGRGQKVDTSLVGGQIYAQASEYTAYLMTGHPPGPAAGGHPLIHSFYGLLATADGHVVIVGPAGRGRAALFETVGRAEWAHDPRYMDRMIHPEVRDAMFQELAEIFRTRTTAEWLEILAGHRIYGVRDYAQVVADPQNHANGYLVHTDDPRSGVPIVVGNPVRLSGTPSEIVPAVPELGEHTDEVLAELGYDRDDIDRMRADGVI